MDTRTLVAIGAFILTLVGGTVAAVDYFAKSSELQLVSMRLEQKIKSDKVWQIQQQIWQLEDRYKGVPHYEWDAFDLERYRRLKMELERTQRGE